MCLRGTIPWRIRRISKTNLTGDVKSEIAKEDWNEAALILTQTRNFEL